VALLFGWLNLVAFSDSLQSKNKVDPCKHDAFDNYLIGPVSYFKRVYKNDSTLINYHVGMDKLWEQAMSAAPKIGPFLPLATKITKPSDRVKKCLSEINQKITKGFDSMLSQKKDSDVRNSSSNDKSIKLADFEKLQHSDSNYSEISTEIDILISYIKRVTNPEFAMEMRLDNLKKAA
jgi:uncharacterized protein YeaO (DUF488 family)